MMIDMWCLRACILKRVRACMLACVCKRMTVMARKDMCLRVIHVNDRIEVVRACVRACVFACVRAGKGDGDAKEGYVFVCDS